MADIGADSIQQRIQIARRDAEALKDRIKRKKDELADTTCTLIVCRVLHCTAMLACTCTCKLIIELQLC